jgi:hypothetical protein
MNKNKAAAAGLKFDTPEIIRYISMDSLSEFLEPANIQPTYSCRLHKASETLENRAISLDGNVDWQVKHEELEASQTDALTGRE